MGGIIGGVGQLIGAMGPNAATTDRKYQLHGYGDLENVFNFGMGQGQPGYKEGAATERGALEQLGGPAAYYQKLLSGNRAAGMQAIAPTVNAANSQFDAQKRQLAATGTARGGGVNAVQQQADTSRMASIDNALSESRQGAAQGATQVAGVESHIGGTQLQAALNLLGLGERSAEALTDYAGQSRATSAALHNQKVKQIGKAVASIIGGFAGLGGGAPASVPFGAGGFGNQSGGGIGT